jgi:pimeloyl-ACP methyl ester carboxylesterase
MENRNMHRELLQVGELTLEYLSVGSGRKVVLCMHGFGREASDFEAFLPRLAADTRLVAINLFCHGRSQFPPHRLSKKPLEAREWCQLIQTLCNEIGCSKFHLVGYSMGGRMAMMLMQHMPDSIESITLIAPDGIKINLLYRFVSETKLGRMLYRSIIRNPKWILRVADVLKGLHILHQNIHRFVYLQLETEAKRQLVYSAWLTHRLLFPDLKRVAANIESAGISCVLVFGKHDAIIPPRLAHKLMRHFHLKPTLLLPEAGHRLINKETVEMLAHENLEWMRNSS